MKRIVASILVALSPAVFAADTNGLAIIPQPRQIQPVAGYFKLSPETKIITDFGSRETGKILAGRLRQSTGYPFKTGLKLFSSGYVPGSILLTTKYADTNLGAEGYELIVTNGFVVIRAPTQGGLFYGVQTLLQLLPSQIFSTNVVTNMNWQVQCVAIHDWPRFQWRGLMLDVSRHFYHKTEVERILDEMALYKLNTFHWHLTDDQGWRIEIKKYPRLTQIGAWRTSEKLVAPRGEGDYSKNVHPAWMTPSADKFGTDGRYVGFYSQADIREVVKYAAARHITVVPEIEMPGHAIAALAAYPQFGCGNANYSTDVKAGVNSGVFDPSNPATFKFLDDVLAEVFQLFPGKFVHVGGDEVDKKVKAATWAKSPQCQALMKREGLKDEDELQNWFTRQIEKFVNAHGRRLIGWSEIAASGVTTNAAVMDWQGGAMEAASSGHDVVMSPTKNVYLDYYQSTNHSTEPHAIGGFLPLEKVYAFEPIPAKLAPEFQSHVLGGQCNLWTEYVASLPHAEYMIFSRECALAEATWSSKESRDWNDFQRRLKADEARMDVLGVNYRRDGGVETGNNPAP